MAENKFSFVFDDKGKILEFTHPDIKNGRRVIVGRLTLLTEGRSGTVLSIEQPPKFPLSFRVDLGQGKGVIKAYLEDIR